MLEKRKIIIIDDDTELTDELKKILSNSGYLVKIYNSPKFINELVRGKPDAILVDIWFDGIADGLNEIKAFKNQDKTWSIPIILMSSDQKIESYAKLIDANRYLNKPFDPEKLLSMLNELLVN